jgi:Rrf2 family transcriptional regulator, cysteine metabolism repressor
MAQLARRFGSGPASLTEIAEQEDLPRAYLEQLVLGLRDADLVRSTRGAHGGYELSRAPELIVMGEVLRALEGPIAPMICASDDPNHMTCARTGYCMVNFMWIRVRDAIAGALDSMTLADLVPRGARQIVPGLPIPPTPADPSTATAAATTVTAAD